MSKFTITLNNGRQLDDLTLNGSMYVSPVELTMDDLGADALKTVTVVEIEDDSVISETVLENAICDGVLSMPEGWLFNLREPTDDERKLDEMMRQIDVLTSMTAKDNIAAGSYFVLHDEVYLATDPIVKGTEIRPGRNCMKKTFDDFMSQEGA